MKRSLLLSILSLFSIIYVYAYDFSVANNDGVIIYYNSSGNNATVTYKSTTDRGYSGNVVIPSQVIHDTVTYSVTSIGDDAFGNCKGLTSITIPNSVTYIGGSAFWGCSGLTSISIPNSVTDVGSSAFSGCNGLANVVLEDGTTNLSFYSNLDQPFAYCPIESLYLGRNINCFSVSSSPFSDKTSLKSLVIGNTVISIDEYLFSGCSGLTSISIPNSVTYIGRYAFSGCSGLTSITISNSVFVICDGVFQDCSRLTSISIPNSVTDIEDYAFSNCIGLTSISIPNSVTYIGHHTFIGCSGLTNVVLEDGIKSISIFSDQVFANCPIERLYLGRNIVYSGSSSSPFNERASLKSLIIGKTVTSIYDNLFSGCNGLTFISIPNSVTDIGDSAFSGCSGLTNVVLEDGTTNLSFASEIEIPFSNCPIERLYLGRNIGSEYSYSASPFREIISLKSLTIGNTVTFFDGNLFSGCSGLTSIFIPNSVTSIGYGAFSGCSGLTSISIPNSVTSIEAGAFADCSGLTNVVLEDGTEELLWEPDFSNSPIESLYLGRNISSYYSPFSDKTTLKSLTIGKNVTGVGNEAFWGSGLTGTLTIPNSITFIGDRAFAGCSNLTSLTIPNSVTFIGLHAFSGCSGFTGLLTIPNSITSISDGAFADCSGLTSLTIPNSVTSVENYAFSGCSGLMEINCENPTPPQAQSYTFDGVNKKACTLYVPAGCAALYASRPVWKDFFNIKEPTSINNFVSNNDISVSITNEGIKITGCNPSERMSIYTGNGQLVYSSVIGNGLISCPLQKGIYIIKIPKKSLKVIY